MRSDMTIQPASLHAYPVRRLGVGPRHHFFGYYDKTVWDRSDRYVLANRVEVMTADLTPDMRAEVGYFDTQDGDRYHVCGSTTAWNWQMGCQLQWLDGRDGLQMIYNVRRDSAGGPYPGFGAAIHDVGSGRTRYLDSPIYVAAPDSRYALTVDYSRLYVTHETIGYCEPGGKRRDLPLHPADDGIRRVDLDTGETRLLVSYADLRDFHHRPSMDKALHWVSHIEINPSSSRILFLHRWTERVEDETCFLHRLITMDPDGGNLRLLECSDHPLPQLAADFDPDAVGTYDYEKSEYQISHPLWRDDRHIIVWGPHDGSIHYHLYEDADGGRVEVIGDGILTENGHMTFSPVNSRWLLTDTYPDPRTNERILMLYDCDRRVRHDLGSFYTDPGLRKENRCDLHPRWSRDGLRICIDSVHEHERQMYLIDVGALVRAD
ncbi:Oligogalacturonate lyase domain-containing protein [Castellaniella denitrificans]